MRKEDFAEALGDINENYIQEAITMTRSKKTAGLKWGTMAACFCLLAAIVMLAPRLLSDDAAPAPVHSLVLPGTSVQLNPEQDEHTEVTRAPWTIHYNEVSSMLAADRPYYKGVFTEPLNDAELAALMPNEDLTCSGYARFDNYGNLLDVVLQAETTLPESPVSIALADYCFGFDYVLSEGEVVSVCNGVDYRVYQHQSGNTVELSAYAIINDIYFFFTMNVPPDDLEQAKQEFRRVLECLAYYESGKPDLSVIVPEEIPELMEQTFSTLDEAQAEPDFGRYMPSELPAGFGDGTIYRFKFQDSNFLSAMWSKGLHDLSWVVAPYTEADAHRLTSVDDKKNYDLSLYPIPRADSVPDELREIVDNPIFEAEELTADTVYCRAYKLDDVGDTDGWRMRFSVRYGDVVVSISAKGVEPEWLYQQLKALHER